MPKLTMLFWDIGGVILSNGWDEAITKEAARVFQYDFDEFQQRHKALFAGFETGQMTLDAYLDGTVFFRERSFTRPQLISYMFAQSTEKRETRAILDELTATGEYQIAALNNEGRELNSYRIHKFDLRRNFSLFLSSCYLGIRKPDEEFYRRALGITQRDAGECLFIDDRLPNVEGAQRVGMRTIHFQNAAQLRAELAQHGVMAGAKA